MLEAELIRESEAGALQEQILSKPESTAEEVIRQSGLLTEEQMQSVKLAEFLLASATITRAAARFRERTRRQHR